MFYDSHFTKFFVFCRQRLKDRLKSMFICKPPHGVVCQLNQKHPLASLSQFCSRKKFQRDTQDQEHKVRCVRWLVYKTCN